jgi:hypothetical protein
MIVCSAHWSPPASSVIRGCIDADPDHDTAADPPPHDLLSRYCIVTNTSSWINHQRAVPKCIVVASTVFLGTKCNNRPQMEGPQLTSPDQSQQKTKVSDVKAIAPGTIPDACKMHSRWYNNLPYSIIHMMRLHAMEAMIDGRYKVRLLITWWPSRTYQHFV